MTAQLTKSPAAAPPPRTAGRRRSPTAPSLALFAFPLPALVIFTFFFAIPTIQAFQYAITDWDGYSADFAYVGVDNFIRAITADDLFANSVVNNVKFLLVVVIVQTLFSLILALAVLRNSRMNIGLRALFFFPTILSSVSVAFIWKFVYDPSFGLGNSILAGLAQIPGVVGLEVEPLQLSYLGNDQMAIFWVAMAQCWAHIGQMMVIYVAGLQAIPSVKRPPWSKPT